MFEFISYDEARKMIDLHFGAKAAYTKLLAEMCSENYDNILIDTIFIPDIIVSKFRFVKNDAVSFFESGELACVKSAIKNVFCFTLVKDGEELFGLNVGDDRFKLLFDGNPESPITNMVWRVVNARN
jgi:hypothetical protein